jgi:hypothetical protein
LKTWLVCVRALFHAAMYFSGSLLCGFIHLWVCGDRFSFPFVCAPIAVAWFVRLWALVVSAVLFIWVAIRSCHAIDHVTLFDRVTQFDYVTL